MSNEEIIEKARNAVLEYDADSAVEAAEEAIKAGKYRNECPEPLQRKSWCDCSS